MATVSRAIKARSLSVDSPTILLRMGTLEVDLLFSTNRIRDKCNINNLRGKLLLNLHLSTGCGARTTPKPKNKTNKRKLCDNPFAVLKTSHELLTRFCIREGRNCRINSWTKGTIEITKTLKSSKTITKKQLNWILALWNWISLRKQQLWSVIFAGRLNLDKPNHRNLKKKLGNNTN